MKRPEYFILYLKNEFLCMFLVSDRPEDDQQQRPKHADINCAARTVLKALVEEIQQDAPVCRYLFTAKLLYMFRGSIAL